MLKRLLAILAFTVALLNGTAAYSQEMSSLISQRLKQAEVNIPADSGGTPEAAKDIALLALQLEETRDKYANALQLQAEGISSAAVVTTARAAYEKVQVQLAGKKNRVKDALSAIDREREVATTMQREYRSQLAATGQLPL